MGVVVLTFPWRKPQRSIGGPPCSRRSSPLVRLAPSQKGERAGCQASPLRSPYHEQWKRRRTPTVRQDCRSLPASVESSLSSYLSGPSSLLDWVLPRRLARVTWRLLRPVRRCVADHSGVARVFDPLLSALSDRPVGADPPPGPLHSAVGRHDRSRRDRRRNRCRVGRRPPGNSPDRRPKQG